MSYQYQDNLHLKSQQRYSAKLKLIAMNICPYKVPAKNPRVYSAEAMESYRSLEAHTIFVSGWVQTVFHMKTDSGHYVLKADVKPSWKVTEEPHHPWVALKQSGPVNAAHCNCMAGGPLKEVGISRRITSSKAKRNVVVQPIFWIQC